MSDGRIKAQSAEDWIEITEQIAEAMRILANCIPSVPGSLEGASIAIGQSGSLVLNQKAWSLCGGRLNAIAGLKTRQLPIQELQIMRFLLAGG